VITHDAGEWHVGQENAGEVRDRDSVSTEQGCNVITHDADDS
jgi:hypothetical protein